MFGFDPEVPAGFQDADIEMLELIEAAERANEPDSPCEDYVPPSWDWNGPCRNCSFGGRSHLNGPHA